MSAIITATPTFYPTVDGARQPDEYIYANVPYVLGISQPPSYFTDVTIRQGESIYDASGYGEFTIGTITDTLPLYIYDDNLLQYTVVPEPATGFLLMGIFLCKKLRRKKWQQ